MESEKLRRRICFEAARLLQNRQESTFTKARWRAARAITRSYISSDALPTDLEIREALQQLVPSDFNGATNLPLVAECDNAELPADRFDQYFALLEPLDRVTLSRDTHPEGDLLYHSLQVYELAKEARAWDEEFLLAALLHDVGKGIDPYDPLEATLGVLDGIISDRTLWFIENLPLQHRSHEGTMGVRARRRLREHDDGEELRLLAECDSEGRVPGRKVAELSDALSYIESLNADETGNWHE